LVVYIIVLVMHGQTNIKFKVTNNKALVEAFFKQKYALVIYSSNIVML